MAVPWRLDDADHDHSHAHEGLARHGGRYADILDAIGHTPLVEIPRMSPKEGVRIFAKLEMLNPTGSVKDRVAKYLIEDLERSGRLTPDSIIVEPTSAKRSRSPGIRRPDATRSRIACWYTVPSWQG